VCAGFEQGLTPAAKALGWTLKSISFAPTPQAEVSAIQTAVQEKPSGIFYTGLDRAAIQSALAQAQAAHIPVVNGYEVDGAKPPVIANIADGPRNEFAPVAAADWIAADGGCKGDTAVYTIPTYPILVYTTSKFVPTLKSLCPSMKVTVVNVQATDVGTKIPTDVTGTLQQNPNIKYVAFSFGDMALGVPAAMKSAGVSAKIVGYGAGEPGNVENVANGSEAAETGYNIPYGGWRAMDAFARYYTGDSYTIDTTAPNAGQLFTSNNAKGVTSWAQMATVNDMPAAFEKLWGVGG
jgi:ribose transport system substrate-binding protein